MVVSKKFTLCFIFAFTLQTASANQLNISTIDSNNDLSIWESHGDTIFFSETAFIAAELPLQVLADALQVTEDLVIIIANLTERQRWMVSTKPQELLNQFDHLLTLLSANTPSKDTALRTTILKKLFPVQSPLTTKPPPTTPRTPLREITSERNRNDHSRRRREIEQFYTALTDDTVKTILDDPNGDLAIQVDQDKLFWFHQSLTNISLILPLIEQYQLEVTNEKKNVSSFIQAHFHNLERTDFFSNVKDFIHALTMLTQGVIPPHFLSRNAVKDALNTLSLKIQERQQGKTLASLEPSAMTDFPIHLARQNDRYFIFVAIPILTPNTKQLPTEYLLKAFGPSASTAHTSKAAANRYGHIRAKYIVFWSCDGRIQMATVACFEEAQLFSGARVQQALVYIHCQCGPIAWHVQDDGPSTRIDLKGLRPVPYMKIRNTLHVRFPIL